jgi:SEC-C motif-containing protein
MSQISRNAPCPCGSGEKYKRCCLKKDEELKQQALPGGRFRYEAGSYGGPGRGYMPSIICNKQVSPGSWATYFCLVKPDIILKDEKAVIAISDKDLETAHSLISAGGGPQDFALSLRHKGYKKVPDFNVVSEYDGD